MGIGFSIFLLAVGAILAFAVDLTVAGLDVHIIGWILMAAGVLGLILTMVLLTPRRRRTVAETPRPVAVSPTVVPVPATAPATTPAAAEPAVPPETVTRRTVRDETV